MTEREAWRYLENAGVVGEMTHVCYACGQQMQPKGRQVDTAWVCITKDCYIRPTLTSPREAGTPLHAAARQGPSVFKKTMTIQCVCKHNINTAGVFAKRT